MAIPSDHANRLIYHFTLIDNLPSLLETGILANNHPEFRGSKHRSIAEPGIQLRRAKMGIYIFS